MKRFRSILGVALIAGIAVGIWFADLFKGFGTGQTGTGGTGGTSSQVVASNTTQATLASTPTPQTGAIPAAALLDPKAEVGVATRIEAPTLAFVQVLIDGRSFLMPKENQWEPVALNQVVERALEAKGDIDGIRIKIARTASSVPSAELALQDALKKKGLPDDAVYWKPAVADTPSVAAPPAPVVPPADPKLEPAKPPEKVIVLP